MMPPPRFAFALALCALGVALGAGTCSLAAEEPGADTASFALASLGLELFLACLALAGGLLSRRPLPERLGLRPSALPASSLGLLVLGTLGVSQGLDGLLALSGLREQSALVQFDAALAGIRGPALLIALLGIGVAPGVAEELLCRGLVQRGLERVWGPGPAVGAAALFFGALHLDPIHGAFATLLGLYLGSVALLARSVRAAILCHVANNVAAVLAVAYLPGAPAVGLGTTLLGFALAAGCLWRVRRSVARRPLQPAGPGAPPLPPTSEGPPPGAAPGGLQEPAGSVDA